MVKETQLYDRLGVSPTASDTEIKKAYRKMALKYHPDKPTGDTEKFKEISEAFDILSDPDKRDTYDQFGLEGAKNGGPGGPGGFGGFSSGGRGHPFGNADASNIFEQFYRSGGMGDDGFSFNFGGSGSPFGGMGGGMPGGSPFGDMGGGMPGGFGGGMGGGMPTREPEPEVSQINLPVSLEDLASGATKKMKLTRKGPSGTREEKIMEIKIAPGWKEGTKITFKNEGDYTPSGRRKTIQFVIQEKPHPFYKRDGNDLIYTLPISFKESLLGFDRTIESIDGRKIPFSRSSPVQPTSENRYPGLGMPISKSPGQRGDLIIKFKIDFPISLTQEQKGAVNQFF